jgi:hypothetical protein
MMGGANTWRGRGLGASTLPLTPPTHTHAPRLAQPSHPTWYHCQHPTQPHAYLER